MTAAPTKIPIVQNRDQMRKQINAALGAQSTATPQTANFTAAVGGFYALRASALTTTLPLSPGATGDVIKVVGLNGDEQAHPQIVDATGSDLIFMTAKGVSSSDTSAKISLTDIIFSFVARVGGWDAAL
jgi:hypothetical protein